MKKIIAIENEQVFIGQDDGSFEQVLVGDCLFEPHVGDEVRIYRNQLRVFVEKIENAREPHESEPSHENDQTSEHASASINNKIQSTDHCVNKVIYCLLAFFAGGFGFHKFYANKPVKGIIYLVFCWTGIPTVIALIEFFIAIFKNSDQNGNIIV